MKVIILIFTMIILCSISYSYEIPLKVNGAYLRFYGKNIDRQNCVDVVSSIPEKYQSGITYQVIDSDCRDFLNTVSVGFDVWSFNDYEGKYFLNTKTIQLFSVCNKYTIVHELTHYKNFVDKLKLSDTYVWDNKEKEWTHTDLFYDIEEQIERDSNFTIQQW
jgi:hypothetical protein